MSRFHKIIRTFHSIERLDNLLPSFSFQMGIEPKVPLFGSRASEHLKNNGSTMACRHKYSMNKTKSESQLMKVIYTYNILNCYILLLWVLRIVDDTKEFLYVSA